MNAKWARANRNYYQPQAVRGFTIVELLIVIVVIGILAALVISTFSGIQGRSRDAKRVSDLQAIAKALHIYNTNNGSFPVPTSVDGSWEISSEDTPADFLEQIKPYGFSAGVPVDPQNQGVNRSYHYYRYLPGDYGCDASRGAYFVIGVRDMESSSGVYPQSPGWSCPSRNWHPEFEWVMGSYEK